MKKYHDKDYLIENYKEKNKSTYDIAEECGVNATTIQKWLKKNNIETRPSNKEKTGCFRHRKDGYAIFRDNSGEGKEKRVYIHRLQAVAKEGIEKVKNKQVHHKNGIKWDNRFENIETISNSEHQQIHSPNGVQKEKELSLESWPDC